jgi:hypothetical protein
MKETHWSARALLTASMISGVVSILAATMTQNCLRRLHGHMDVRLWLSNVTSTSRNRYDRPYNILPLKSSVVAQQLVAAPTKFLMIAITLYIIGFGLYLLFGWLYALTQPTSDFRNIFVVYIVAVCLSALYLLILGTWQEWNEQKLQERLKIDRYAPYIHASEEYKSLETIIALIIEFRKKNERTSQIGREETIDPYLGFEVLLQLWDGTDLSGKHGSRGCVHLPGTVGLESQERVEEHGDCNGTRCQRFSIEALENCIQGENSDLRSVPQHATTVDRHFQRHSRGEAE